MEEKWEIYTSATLSNQIYLPVKYYKKQKKERYKQKIQLDIFPEGNTY